MESAEKKVKGKLADLKFILQYIYTRFCQANCFTGRFAETIIEDLIDLQDLIPKVKLNGDKLLDSLKGTHAEEVNAICGLYLERMDKVLAAAKKESDNYDNKTVIQKCQLTVETGLMFIDAINEIKVAANCDE